ncbi:hypothetical protein QTG54_011612 [Skeletonema marinoi]|uniref:Uncharacterized protein n=1 Tax=Skeletonema marinoi TaxID=267567 RepID=A0AAD8Y2Y2_9STRA|nr:hypothetical protein QTG54_011612 [Skeletonema marinoi]
MAGAALLQRLRRPSSLHEYKRSSHHGLHAEQPNNALLSDLKELQSKEASSALPDYFIADSFNDETTAAAMADELKGINSGGNLMMAATAATSTEERTPPPS